MATRLYLLTDDWDTGRKKLSTTAGASQTDYVVRTAAAAQAQWTVSDGGQVLEWCSEPLASGATISSAVTFNIWAVENNMSANAGGRARLYKVSNDRATWTEMGGGPWDDGVEFTLGSKGVYNWTGTPTSNNSLSTGERLGVRFYSYLSTQNVDYLATMGLNGGTADADGDTWIETVETLSFSQPALTGTGSESFTAISDTGVARLLLLRASASETFAGLLSDTGNGITELWTRPSETFTGLLSDTGEGDTPENDLSGSASETDLTLTDAASMVTDLLAAGSETDLTLTDDPGTPGLGLAPLEVVAYENEFAG